MIHAAITRPEDEFFDTFDSDRPAACPSCQGREWNAVTEFEGEGDDTELTILRVPCGCTTGRIRTVDA
jgi:hypothetical protein